MSLAETREKRNNAGNRMSRLLDEDEDEEFYKTTYGGFAEEADDNDYASEKSESDGVDSDFSIDENDEVRSDLEDGDEPKRKRRVVTKAYKEPVQKPTTSDEKQRNKAQPVKTNKVRPKSRVKSTVQIYKTEPEKKSLRRSTTSRTQEVHSREKQRQARVQMMKEIAVKKNVAEVRRLTQEELLEEAKLTEQINLRSLETYQRLESEKKKARVQKQVYRGPIIRYHSVTMPLIEELPTETEISVDDENGENAVDGESAGKNPTLKASDKCSRTFITFTDEKLFNEYFRKKKRRPPIKQYCPVTRHAAKYFDPITQTPYVNAKAFRIIREAYMQQLDEKDSKRRIKSNGND